MFGVLLVLVLIDIGAAIGGRGGYYCCFILAWSRCRYGTDTSLSEEGSDNEDIKLGRQY